MLNSKLNISISFLFFVQLTGCLDEEPTKTSEETNMSELAVDVENLISINNENNTLASEQGQSLIESAKEEMSLLVANSEFDFTSKQQIDVTLDLIEELSYTDKIDQRAYVSIYRDYQLLDSGTFYPNASSRIIGGDLQNGIFNHSFVSLNNQSSYLVEVWFYNGEEPIQKEIEVVGNSLTW